MWGGIHRMSMMMMAFGYAVMVVIGGLSAVCIAEETHENKNTNSYFCKDCKH